MDRLISEQAVIDATCKVCGVVAKPSECMYKKGLFGGCEEYKAIKAIPSTEPKWIPVSEKLPKESDGTVLITVNGKVKTGRYSEFSNTWYKGDMCGVGGDDPIAWMPLPKPYESQESEG